MRTSQILALFCLLCTIALSTNASELVPRQSSAEGSRAYIISPADGETVSPKFTVKFGLQGMGIAPAGIDRANTGHHHLLVDIDTLPDLNQPMAGTIKHFGGGQTETVIELAPGKHTLQLILGDRFHIPHHPAVISEPITVFVKE